MTSLESPLGCTATRMAFFSRFKTRLYGFAPSTLYYTDNRFGFATRQPIDWETGS